MSQLLDCKSLSLVVRMAKLFARGGQTTLDFLQFFDGRIDVFDGHLVVFLRRLVVLSKRRLKVRRSFSKFSTSMFLLLWIANSLLISRDFRASFRMIDKMKMNSWGRTTYIFSYLWDMSTAPELYSSFSGSSIDTRTAYSQFFFYGPCPTLQGAIHWFGLSFLPSYPSSQT